MKTPTPPLASSAALRRVATDARLWRSHLLDGDPDEGACPMVGADPDASLADIEAVEALAEPLLEWSPSAPPLATGEDVRAYVPGTHEQRTFDGSWMAKDDRLLALADALDKLAAVPRLRKTLARLATQARMRTTPCVSAEDLKLVLCALQCLLPEREER